MSFIERRFELLVGLSIAATSAAMGWAVATGESKPLVLTALFTLHVLLRRWRFQDFYLLAISISALGQWRLGFVVDEADVRKWHALFAMAGVSAMTVIVWLPEKPWPGRYHLLVGSFLGLCVWSIDWSIQPVQSFQKAGVFGVAICVAWIGAWAHAGRFERLRALVDVHVDWLWAVFPLSLLVAPLGSSWGGGLSRFRGVFSNPNSLGFFCGAALPLLFALSLTEPRPMRRRFTRFLLVCAVLCALLCGSRGALVGAMIGIGLYAACRWPMRVFQLSMVGGLILSTVALVVASLGHEFQDVMVAVLDKQVRFDTLWTLSNRTLIWAVAIAIGQNRHWLGHGFGVGDNLFGLYGLDSKRGPLPAVHSSYLEAYMNIGLIGTSLMVLVIAACLFAGIRCYLRDRHGTHGLLALALTASATGTALHGAVETTLLSVGNPWSLPFWMTLALIVRLSGMTPKSGVAPP
ncbi:MAG: O-antigen ligase family protein [Acidobacteriota bacterium]